MKTALLMFLFASIWPLTVHAQAVYVDSKTGDDRNPGTKEAPVFSVKKAAEIVRSSTNNIYTIKLSPGIYILDHHVSVETKKEMAGKRVLIEASILPDEPSWTPDKMPVIASRASKGEIPGLSHWVVGLLINESHVTIRGIKFHGYFYPHTRYFPIARFNKTKTDLKVEQCMFVGDANVSQIQVGVIAFENEITVDHCIFYKLRNAVVFAGDSGRFTNSIIFGTSQAVWTASPAKGFDFENNVVADCRYVWVNNYPGATNCSMNNCVVLNNKHYTGIPDSSRLKPGEFEINEKGVVKEGEISLRLTGVEDRPFLDEIDRPLPVDYMHVVPGTPGYDIGAGLFKYRKL